MAQLVAHHTGSVGVRGSSPLSSTLLTRQFANIERRSAARGQRIDDRFDDSCRSNNCATLQHGRLTTPNLLDEYTNIKHVMLSTSPGPARRDWQRARRPGRCPGIADRRGRPMVDQRLRSVTRRDPDVAEDAQSSGGDGYAECWIAAARAVRSPRARRRRAAAPFPPYRERPCPQCIRQTGHQLPRPTDADQARVRLTSRRLSVRNRCRRSRARSAASICIPRIRADAYNDRTAVAVQQNGRQDTPWGLRPAFSTSAASS
jgi:hypothetical protein